MNAPHIKTDVTIVGAGLVGMTAALSLSKIGYDVVLLDSQIQHTPDYPDDDWDQRIYAISPKNKQWLSTLDIWDLLDQSRITPMQSMEIWGDTSTQPLQLNAEDVSADCLGFILEERLLKDAIFQCIQSTNIHLVVGQCVTIQATELGTVVKLQNDQTIESTLLLAADGANSWVRQQLDIGLQHKHYEQTAIVANFTIQKPHANVARQWFTQDAERNSAVLAWLPLANNKVSIVWSAPVAQAERLLKLSFEALTHEVVQAGGNALGDMTIIGEPASFPLSLKVAEKTVMKSVVFIGDAAHRVHPMAGQGVNLGFRDVIDLLHLLENKHVYQPINDAALLKQYARIRKADVLNMVTLTSGLYHLFENPYPIIKTVRNWGLAATNQHMLKKMLITKAIAL